jgi:hypothetical protein
MFSRITPVSRNAMPNGRTNGGGFAQFPVARLRSALCGRIEMPKAADSLPDSPISAESATQTGNLPPKQSAALRFLRGESRFGKRRAQTGEFADRNGTVFRPERRFGSNRLFPIAPNGPTKRKTGGPKETGSGEPGR